MAKAGVPRHDPVPIGDVATPAFVRLPEPARLFGARANRFAQLAEGHELRPYLLFLAGLSAVQHQIQAELPEPDMPDVKAIARAREFGMPPLDRGRFTADPA